MSLLKYPPNRLIIFCGFIVVSLSYAITAVLIGFLTRADYLSTEHILLISRLMLWLFLGVLLLFLYKIEKQSLLLWPEKKYSFGFYLLSIIVLIGVLFIGMILIVLIIKTIGVPINNSKRLEQMMVVFKQNKFLMIFTAFTAGITEELIFRAYLIPRLQLFLKNAYLSIAISSLLFGLMHISYGTLIQFLGPLLIGLIFGIHYYKFRNIKILIICHFLWDLLAMVMKTR